MFRQVDDWCLCCWAVLTWRQPGCYFVTVLSHRGLCRGLCPDLLFLNCSDSIVHQYRCHLPAPVSRPRPFLEFVPLELPPLVGRCCRFSSCCYQHHGRGSCPILRNKLHQNCSRCLCGSCGHYTRLVRAEIGAVSPLPPWPVCDPMGWFLIVAVVVEPYLYYSILFVQIFNITFVV